MTEVLKCAKECKPEDADRLCGALQSMMFKVSPGLELKVGVDDFLNTMLSPQSDALLNKFSQQEIMVNQMQCLKLDTSAAFHVTNDNRTTRAVTKISYNCAAFRPTSSATGLD
jgi:hypothetical protein